jgi:hypothetical protein
MRHVTDDGTLAVDWKWSTYTGRKPVSGYGGKIPSDRMIYFKGRWRRMYVACYGNSGSCYVLVKGEAYYILDHELGAEVEAI